MRVNRRAATVIGSEKARALQRQVWKEIVTELRTKVPEGDSYRVENESAGTSECWSGWTVNQPASHWYIGCHEMTALWMTASERGMVIGIIRVKRVILNLF